MAAYRFVFCILNGVLAGYDDVVRHRCNNRRCINPDHLEVGSRGDGSRPRSQPPATTQFSGQSQGDSRSV
ncbi:HNH endonuclease [Cypionkella sp.]|uniref:HNH endonuclease n=1 Tax=Cypionkella sp. TaxID=2811411 RepID=UPI00351D4563